MNLLHFNKEQIKKTLTHEKINDGSEHRIKLIKISELDFNQNSKKMDYEEKRRKDLG
jgi:hypothetical protein